MVHLSWNKNKIGVYFDKFIKLLSERGFYQQVPTTVLKIMNVLSKYLVKKDVKLVETTQNEDFTKEIFEKYVDRVNQLPKINEVTEDKLDTAILSNFEGIVDSLKSSLTFIEQMSDKKIENYQEKVTNLYTSIIEPNIIQVFSDKTTLFNKCVSNGDSNIKNKYFEICLIFCKIDEIYLFKVLNFLTSVYIKGDFKINDYQMMEVRTQDYIGLKNLGCTCYANSLFQQLFHNKLIQNEIMGSTPDKTQGEQMVLFEVKRLFWRLSFTKMNHAYLDNFCRVFTCFEGLPINVRVQ